MCYFCVFFEKGMETVQLLDKSFKTLIDQATLSKAIDRVATKINADFKDCDDVPVLLCVLNGSIMFTSELMKRLKFNLEVVSIKLTSYSGTTTTGRVERALGPTADVKGRRVIVVEDIIDTGNTIVALNEILHDRGAAEVRVCTMLFKPEVYKKDVHLDYVGIEIPNKFIVGFGLDYNEMGRNLDAIYVLDE